MNSLSQDGVAVFYVHNEKNPSGFHRRGSISRQIRRTYGLCQALALGALTSKFASAAHSFCLLASLLFRWLFEVRAGFHFPEETLTLHLLFQRAKGLFDIVVADDDLYDGSISISSLGW